ncbi:hypothetical protein CIL03_08360 [Virgibacillus indicus]|uniref:DNA-binding protein n=1 Tax=Virgibacillus indicus TaxID=2024554 RepID=A0A265NAF6_9BACI|nr:hypothetical protein [Virgibacillus indicus]OZU89020.1 hypothetical protein CIL03_08360 [Virgibacillus indicus]
MQLTLDELKAKLLEENLKELFIEAYKQGVKDGQDKYYYPDLLTKKDLIKIFQVKEPTVNKIVAIPGFPKSQFVTARYPRDEVFKWINNNSISAEEINIQSPQSLMG